MTFGLHWFVKDPVRDRLCSDVTEQLCEVAVRLTPGQGLCRQQEQLCEAADTVFFVISRRVADPQAAVLPVVQQFDIEKAGNGNVDMISRTMKIEQYPDRLCVRDTDGGKDVQGRIADLQQLLAAYRSGLVRTPDRMG